MPTTGGGPVSRERKYHVQYDPQTDVEGFALGSIVAASSGLATGCAPSSPLSDAGNANGTEKVYQFAKRTSEYPIEFLSRLMCSSSAAGEQGCAAALAAAEEGARVAICEKTSMFGGATALSSGKIPAVGTAQQKEKEDSDSIGACAMDIMRPSNYSVRPDLVYTAVEHSRDIVEWTEASVLSGRWMMRCTSVRRPIVCTLPTAREKVSWTR